jgi:hypothetical protein
VEEDSMHACKWDQGRPWAPSVPGGAWPDGQGVCDVAAVGCGKVSQQLLSRGALWPGWCTPCAAVHAQRQLLLASSQHQQAAQPAKGSVKGKQ